jgi:hypothetical protein
MNKIVMIYKRLELCRLPILQKDLQVIFFIMVRINGIDKKQII